MINQETVIVTVVLVALAFALPRKYFLLPFVITACFVPADQRIIIMGLDFTPLRLLIVTGVLRLCLRGELRTIKLNRFDKILLLWAFCGAAIFVLQRLDMSSLIYKCGLLFDVLGLYWLFRQNIQSWADIHFIFTLFALCALVMLPLVAFEWATGRNPFSAFGRVGTVVRESGRYRCQASFPHSIMLGLFWATLVPVFVGLSKAERWKYLYWAAAAAGVFIVCATNSSTPIGTLIGVVLVLPLFRYRSYGRLIAYGICGMTVGLHLIMKAPVWHLIGRMSIVSGSTGYHRYRLIDQAIRHFGEWALLGTRSTAHWGGLGLTDITNQYIRQGIDGGFITLLLFVVLLVMAIRIAGVYSIHIPQVKLRFLSWCISVSILGHCLAFIGISYFGQIHMLLYLTFAIVGVIYEISSTSLRFARSINPNLALMNIS